MPSSYPAALDSLPTTRADGTVMAGTHPADHNTFADAINRIEAELGVLPKGAFASVAARLGAISVSQIYAEPPILTGKQTLAVSITAVTLTVPATSTHAFITVEAGDVRYWEDGSTPTGMNGLYFPAGASAELTNLNNLKFIKAAGQPDATLQISYRKYV